jgi:hypothetical protein
MRECILPALCNTPSGLRRAIYPEPRKERPVGRWKCPLWEQLQHLRQALSIPRPAGPQGLPIHIHRSCLLTSAEPGHQATPGVWTTSSGRGKGGLVSFQRDHTTIQNTLRCTCECKCMSRCRFDAIRRSNVCLYCERLHHMMRRDTSMLLSVQSLPLKPASLFLQRLAHPPAPS